MPTLWKVSRRDVEIMTFAATILSMYGITAVGILGYSLLPSYEPLKRKMFVGFAFQTVAMCMLSGLGIAYL
jgi:hypothetical protein